MCSYNPITLVLRNPVIILYSSKLAPLTYTASLLSYLMVLISFLFQLLQLFFQLCQQISTLKQVCLQLGYLCLQLQYLLSHLFYQCIPVTISNSEWRSVHRIVCFHTNEHKHTNIYTDHYTKPSYHNSQNSTWIILAPCTLTLLPSLSTQYYILSSHNNLDFTLGLHQPSTFQPYH